MLALLLSALLGLPGTSAAPLGSGIIVAAVALLLTGRGNRPAGDGVEGRPALILACS